MKKKMYSPMQISTSAFLGGPISGIICLRENFNTLSKGDYSQKTIIFGGVFLLVFFLGIPFIPETKSPNYLLPLLIGWTFRFLAEKFQLKKDIIKESDDFEFHSNWRVVTYSVLSLAVTFMIAVGIIIIYEMLGIIKVA